MSRSQVSATLNKILSCDEELWSKVVRGVEGELKKAAIEDREKRMNFFDFPAEHWQSIRTTNPIESTFATIRHRTRTTRGCLSHDTMLDMMFKLGQCAESRWRRLRGFRRLGQVIEGVPFKDGIEVQSDQKTVAAG